MGLPQDLLKIVQEGSVDELREYFSKQKVEADAADEDGMTLLMHAVYKGRLDTCKFLLARKADVNNTSHRHGYTALMFGAMSGSISVTRALLAAGANPDETNNIGRNAATLAAFIGNYGVSTLINYYYPRSALDAYSIPRGLEKQPKIPPYVVPALHDLLNAVNLHPVSILLTVQENSELVCEVRRVKSLIDLLVEKVYKEESNETLSYKFHIIGEVLALVIPKDSAGTGTSLAVNIESVIKGLLKGRRSDAFPVALETFLRKAIRDYPYHQTVMLNQLVAILSPVEIGNHPTAIKSLNGCLFGLQRYDESTRCAACGTDVNVRKCTGCSSVLYCGRKCQGLHWSTHKKHCAAAGGKKAAADSEKTTKAATSK